MIRVLLADDHALIRTGFRMILDAQHGIKVIGEAANGNETVARARELRPDVVLMDIHMPAMDGVAATAQITQAENGVRILALSNFDLDRYVVSALRAGAAGFLPKDVSPEELVEAVRVVHGCEAAVAPRLLTRLISTFVCASPPRPASLSAPLSSPRIDGLTERERDVLTLIALGRSNPEIAESLGISVSTVKNHLARVFAEIGVRDRAQAVIVAYEAGLVTPGGRG